ncbi:hypothetical protein FRB96_002146 [Tulasnella sp. 330]|nr:hypothetical protein FRB96_002146 [Tulasnella sp. 330]
MHSLIWRGPTVESLKLFLETKGYGSQGEVYDLQAISDFFTQMGILCPALKDLDLAGQGIGADSIVVAAQTIGQLDRLQTFDLGSHDEHDIAGILPVVAGLPVMESLGLNNILKFQSQWSQ